METQERPIEHLEVYNLWEQIFTPEDPDPEILKHSNRNNDPESFDLSTTFDYDLTDKDNILFFCDVTIWLPGKAIQCTRCTFKVDLPTFPDVFTIENLRFPVDTTIYYAFDALKDTCDENSLLFPPELDHYERRLSDTFIDGICSDLVNIFKHNRVPFDMKNRELFLYYGLKFGSGWETEHLMVLTFSVIDQLIYKNAAYNRIHNREVFFDQVPEMRYNSLRLKCAQIDRQDVNLTDIESIFFLKCIDCSVQILLSNIGDRLQPVLEEWGVSAEVLNNFYKSATRLFKIYHKPQAEKFLNAPRPNWEKLLK